MILVVSVVKNEEYYLPTFIEHIRDYVDGFIFLDDGSTDKTIDIINKEPKTLKIIKNPITDSIDYDEAGNRKKILRETYKLSKDKNNTWVLCCDPDERFEKRFLKKMRDYCTEDNNTLYGLHFRELHNNIKTYRCDGIWDGKRKFILFKLQKEMDFDSVMPFKRHVCWHYREIADKSVMTDYNLYHLKMIKTKDRKKRAKLYNDLDPNLEVQPIGYDYLYDNANMKLKKLNFINKYDYKYVPEDLKKYNEK